MKNTLSNGITQKNPTFWHVCWFLQDPVKYGLFDYIYIYCFYNTYTKKLLNTSNHIILTQIIFDPLIIIYGNRITFEW